MNKVLLLLLVVLPFSIHAQSTNIVTIPPSPVVHFCNAPANAVPCTNYATTYTDSTLTTSCPTSKQIVLDGTNVCVSSPDAQNNWGVWVPSGQYAYTVTIGTTNFGPYFVTAASSTQVTSVFGRTGAVIAAANDYSAAQLSNGVTGSGTVVLATGPVIASPTSTGTDSGTETLTNKTLNAPVLNSTPTGTGIPTITGKKGSGSGTDYSTTSATYVDVDATNLAYTVTIPTGWKLAVTTSGEAQQLTAAAGTGYQLFDTQGSTVIHQIFPLPSSLQAFPFTLTGTVTGDGLAHTIKVQFKTGNAADATNIINQSSGRVMSMTFILSPSN